MGANITCGGRVEGENVTCPFHEWSFDGETGKCTDIPYASKVPDFAKIKTYKCLEVNKLIFLWYHAEGDEPHWEPPKMPNVESGSWVYHGRHEFEVASHIEDLPENGADVAHLNAIHKSSVAIGGEPSRWMEKWTQKMTWHEWGISWEALTEETQKHIAVVRLKHFLQLGNTKAMEVNVIGEQIGPSLVHLHFDSWMGKGIMFQYVLPLEPLLQKFVHVFYADKTWLPPLAKFSLYGESCKC